MSLFKARDWWSTLVGEDEEFDQGCMCVGNLDNSSGSRGELSYLVTTAQSFHIIKLHTTHENLTLF